jgi:cyclopropane-fatty-acyl-phospholipid synthase
MKKEQDIIADLAAKAGIIVNGPNPWDIQVHNKDFYSRVLRSPYLGLGESYVDGWWDCAQLDEFFSKVLRANLENELKSFGLMVHYLRASLVNLQKKSRSLEVAHKHYDIGNHLYELMLGESMAYTCAYWKNAKNLDEAQAAKFDLVCKKIGLKPGMKVLDLGCGFGSFLKYAAEHYKISGVGVNISKEQIAFAREWCKGLPLEFQLIDYREAKGTFDRVVSIGLAEHVGYKNYKTLFKLAHDRLDDNGLFLLHTIGCDISETITDPWIDKYIFPNGNFPSIKQLGGAMEGLFIMEDWHNFGADYDKTLMAWYRNFSANWPSIEKEYGEQFYRMWTYYLLSSAGAFRARSIHLWQLVLSKEGVVGGYTSVR